MTEIRCVKCRRLLMKANRIDAKIKCPKCGYLQKVVIGLQVIGEATGEVFEDEKLLEVLSSLR